MSSAVRSVADKVGVVGSLVSTTSCAMCFPAAASIGAAIGLGFLSRWEPLFLKILPLFAAVVLVANGLGWLTHRQWGRTILGMIGPSLVLIGRFTFVSGVLYAGLVAMVVFGAWDMVSPANRRCAPESCELPTHDHASTKR